MIVSRVSPDLRFDPEPLVLYTKGTLAGKTPMYILLMIVHVVVCLFLIVVVLLQSGKAADLAGAFGGMGSQTAFGPRGSATLLSRATTISAVLFMVTSLSLSVLASKSAGLATTVLEDVQQKSAPAKKSTPIPAPQPAVPQGGNTMQLPVPPAPAPAKK